MKLKREDRLRKIFNLMLVALVVAGASITLNSTGADASSSKVEKAFLKEMAGHSKKIKAYLKGHPSLKREKRLGNHETVEFLAIAIQDLAKRAPQMLKSAAKKNKKNLVKRAKAVQRHARDIEVASLTGSKEKIMAAYEGFEVKLKALGK
ncbi:MAG: hypothetical protein ACO3N9_10635 [Alphaproteobacteria bacterium]